MKKATIDVYDNFVSDPFVHGMGTTSEKFVLEDLRSRRSNSQDFDRRKKTMFHMKVACLLIPLLTSAIVLVDARAVVTQGWGVIDRYEKNDARAMKPDGDSIILGKSNDSNATISIWIGDGVPSQLVASGCLVSAFNERSSSVVLTSAHVIKLISPNATIWVKFEIFAGVEDKNPSVATYRLTERPTIHPAYSEGQDMAFDLALCKLPEPAPPQVRPYNVLPSYYSTIRPLGSSTVDPMFFYGYGSTATISGHFIAPTDDRRGGSNSMDRYVEIEGIVAGQWYTGGYFVYDFDYFDVDANGFINPELREASNVLANDNKFTIKEFGPPPNFSARYVGSGSVAGDSPSESRSGLADSGGPWLFHNNDLFGITRGGSPHGAIDYQPRPFGSMGVVTALSMGAPLKKGYISNWEWFVAIFYKMMPISNAPPVFSRQPISQTALSGGTVSFSTAVESVVSNGTTLSFQWKRNGIAIAGATSATLTVNNVQLSDAGAYSVEIANGSGSATSGDAMLTVIGGEQSRISNVSVRTHLESNQMLIVGLTMAGGAKSTLIRAIGPGLIAFGVADTMPDPRLSIFDGPVQVQLNDNWGGGVALASAAASVGAFGLSEGSFDAAMVYRIDGARSAQVSGLVGGTVLVEAYDAGTGMNPRLINISARNRVGTGSGILIAGFTISGTGAKNVLIRGVGPTLAVFGVSEVLADPKIEVFSGSTKILENDSWIPSLAPLFSSVGAFALNSGSKDAALLASLPAGSYTVQVSGADGGIGEALVEIYEIQP